jgi:hypothetical protein
MTALLIFVPGAVSKPAAYKALLGDIVEGHPGCRVRTWDRPMTVFSRIPLGLRAANLSGQIKNWLLQLDDEGHEIDEILLVGHSVGGLTARDAYLIDLGGAADWAPLVKRIALLATPNRGVDHPRLPFKYRLPMLLFGWLFTDRVVWKQTLRGSAYVTNLRVRWIRRFNQTGFLPPYIVQLRAEDDPIVLPEDSRDVWQFANAGEEVVSGSTHRNIASVDGPDGVVAQRVQILRRALFGSPIVNDPPAVSPKEAVALLLHGIRSSSTGWPERVAAQLGEVGGQEIECVRPSYGYLPALDFALTPLRRSRKRWIRDAYSDSFARYPQAAFHFVGHSNGTYLFRLLLNDVGGARFESAYLGGCVLPRSMSWDRHLDGGEDAQIQRVLHVTASNDWPVAWLCGFLRGIGMRDLGTAGADNFNADHPSLTQPYCVAGNHGAAFAGDAADRIARWVLDGEVVQPEQAELASGPSGTWRLVSRISQNVVLATAAAAFVVAAICLTPLLLIGAFVAGGAFVMRVM